MSEPVEFGRYILQERLAVGQIADIYRATTTTSQGQTLVVVIKRIRDELSRDPAFSGAFIDEAKIASSLDHPNIAKVYEWSRQDDSLFIAMEYIEGTNLASLMQSCSEQSLRFPPTLAIYIVSEILAGLEYAHGLKDAYGDSLKIVHRGVNPHNVVVSSDGKVKLVDFGMARASNRVHGTRPGVFSGQRTYMAPEVFSSSAVDGRADGYSVGVLLYELLTGIKLHDSGESESIYGAISSRLPSSVYTDIPVDLDNAIQKAVNPEPDGRFASAGQMREELNSFLIHWDKQVDPPMLSSFLVEALSGRSAGKSGGGFAFGEATSHWFSEGEDLLRMDPLAASSPAPEAAPVPESEPDFAPPPKGSFTAGSTVMAVEQSGLGKKRHLKTSMYVGAGILAVALLMIFVISGLSSKPDLQEAKPKIEEKQEQGFSGPVQVTTDPPGALIFVDGDPVKPAGSPPRILNLRSGKRRFKLLAPGYIPWEGDVELVTSQPKDISKSLEPIVGTVVIRSKPSRAKVYMDGKRKGHTPISIENVSGAKAHKLVLKRRGYLPVRFEINPSDWQYDKEAKLVFEKELKRPKKRRRRRRRR